MTVTFLGYLFVPLAAFAFLTGRRSWMPWLLAASMPFGTSPAVIAGANSVPAFYLVAFAALGFVVIDGFSKRPGVTHHLYSMALWAAGIICLGATLLPIVFAGTAVLLPRGGIDEQVAAPGSLAFSATNIAQMGYFVLALSIVVFFANNRPNNLHFLNIGFIVGSVLNLWALVANRTGLYWPAWIFDTSNESGYYKNVTEGVERFRGVFSEPSYLATFSIAALVFNVFLAAQLRGWQRLGVLAIAGINVLSLYSSYSGTAVVGFIATWAIIGAFYTALFLMGRARINVVAAIIGSFSFSVLAFLSPPVIEFVNGIITGKLESSSYTNRSMSNDFSWNLFFETYMLGSGLGSSRPSGFLFMLLSNVGLIGTIIFGFILYRVVKPAISDGRFAPEIWCVVATIVTKVVAEPNMSQPTMWLSMAACAAALALQPADPPLNDGKPRKDIKAPGRYRVPSQEMSSLSERRMS